MKVLSASASAVACFLDEEAPLLHSSALTLLPSVNSTDWSIPFKIVAQFLSSTRQMERIGLRNEPKEHQYVRNYSYSSWLPWFVFISPPKKIQVNSSITLPDPLPFFLCRKRAASRPLHFRHVKFTLKYIVCDRGNAPSWRFVGHRHDFYPPMKRIYFNNASKNHVFQSWLSRKKISQFRLQIIHD